MCNHIDELTFTYILNSTLYIKMYTLYGIERSADSAKSYQRKIHQNKSQIGSCGLKRKHRICLVIQTFNVRNTDISLQAYLA